MTTQTIEIRATRGTSSTWWIALAVAAALVVSLVLVGARAAGDNGGATKDAGTTTGPARTLVVTEGPAAGHPLP